MASKGFCRHFPHLGIMNDYCEAGVEIRTVRDESIPARFACCNPSVKHLCPKYEPYTDEEIAESDRFFTEALDRVLALESRTSEECPQCGKHIAALEQIGRCVYSRPCGCRQWQGGIPDAWKAQS